MSVAAVLYDRGAVTGVRERTGADRGRFGPVLAYAMLASATQLLWLTFAPLTTASAHHYHTSETAIGWLAEIFPLLYLVLALPAGRLLDRSLHRWLGFGAALTALGGIARLLGPQYGWALFGQVLVAVGQPFVLNAVTKVAAEHLPPERRPHGIAVGSAGIFGGMLLALVLGTIFGGAHLEALLAVQALFGVLAAIATVATLRAGSHPAADEPSLALDAVALRAVWADRGVRVLAGLLFIGFGAFIALCTWLQALLHNYRVSSTTAGTLLVAMVLAGAVGAAALPPIVVNRHAERRIVGASVAVTVVGALLLAFEHAVAVDAIALVPIGLLLLTDLPVILELSERRAGAAAGTVTALLWLAGNAGGVLVALLVQVLVHHPTSAFLALAVIALCAAPLVVALVPQEAAHD